MTPVRCIGPERMGGRLGEGHNKSRTPSYPVFRGPLQNSPFKIPKPLNSISRFPSIRNLELVILARSLHSLSAVWLLIHPRHGLVERRGNGGQVVGIGADRGLDGHPIDIA